MPENKILIIRGGAIGDFILTLPVLSALRRQFRETRLEVLGYPHIAELALAGSLADAVRPIEARPLAGFFARGGTLAPELADYFAGFAIIVSYLYDPDRIFQENVARVTKTQFIAGPHRPNETGHLHASEVFLKPLERLAIFDTDPVPRLHVGQASRLSRVPGNMEPVHDGQIDQRHVSSVLDRQDACPLLALHTGSGSERKNWPEANWLELLHHLVTRTNRNLLLVGGEAEGDRLVRLVRQLPTTRMALAQSLPLVELAGRLESCTAFIGHDSGITHLAAALGLPTLALWGDTTEVVWRPLGERVTILRALEGIRGIPVAQVAAELARQIEAPNARPKRTPDAVR